MFINEQIIPAHKKFDRGDVFWLVYLIFFLIEPAARKSLAYWAASLGCIAIFVSLYLLFLRFCNVRLRLVLLSGMFLLGLVTYPTNNGGSCFMIYAAALLPFVLGSIPLVLMGQVLECLLLCAEGFWFHISPWSWFSSILLIMAIGAGNIGFAQKQRADRKLRMKQEEIESLAALAERERIARDLHDVLGHTLSVIVLKAELASRLLQRELTGAAPLDPANLGRAQAEVADVERTARTALAEVREAIGGYRARGLAAEIDAARSTLASAGVTLLTEGPLRPAPTLSAAEETVLALALREAVTNIVRHAGASTCHLRLLVHNGQHQLFIEDDGRHATAREGNGLRGMRERVEALGGQLSLTRNAGTSLTIDLPARTT